MVPFSRNWLGPIAYPRCFESNLIIDLDVLVVGAVVTVTFVSASYKPWDASLFRFLDTVLSKLKALPRVALIKRWANQTATYQLRRASCSWSGWASASSSGWTCFATAPASPSCSSRLSRSPAGRSPAWRCWLPKGEVNAAELTLNRNFRLMVFSLASGRHNLNSSSASAAF